MRCFENGINVRIHELQPACKQRRTIEGVLPRTRIQLNPQFPENENSVAIVIGDNLQVMLITQALFNSLTEKESVDTGKYAQMTIALAFESREKVDEIVNTAVSLGGKSYAEPEEYGFMYHWGFVDLDADIWAINYMNMDAAQG